MLSFANLSELDDKENDIQIYDEPIENAQASTGTTEQKLCGTCVSKVPDCVLVPCGHVYFCMDCYNKWRLVDTSAFEFMDEDGSMIEMPDIDEPLQEPSCPYCKESVQTAVQLRQT